MLAVYLKVLQKTQAKMKNTTTKQFLENVSFGEKARL